MAQVHRAVDPDLLRWVSQVADATEVTVYDADFPHEVGQQFVSAVIRNAEGEEIERDLTSADWHDLRRAIEEEAAVHGDTVKFVLDLGDPAMLTLRVEVTNVYDDGESSHQQVVTTPPPPDLDDEDELSEWAENWLFPLTGTGRETGEAGYFVKILEAPDAALVGREFEWFG